ncbi:MAG TPA: cobalamin-dependent protein [Trebonia sp.]|nr:cobalamin-dependent protein [Trebonia sp.]
MTERALDMRDDPGIRRAGRLCVVSSVSSDAHTWNLSFLQLLLEEHGFDVINLGACVPDELLLETCRTYRPCAVVISTVNGHGRIDGLRLARRFRDDPSLEHMPLVIGGKLGLTAGDSPALRAQLIRAGFDAVFEDGDGTGPLLARLALLSPEGRR